MNYFHHPFVSNSDLTRLKQELSGKDAMDTTAAFHFGTLVHAVILEPHTVDMFRRRIVGVDHEYGIEDINTARKMNVSFLNDSYCRRLLQKSEIEKEMYNEDTRFSFNGIDFTLGTRRKYDGWLSLVNFGWDLKSTTATTQSQFDQAVKNWDYDRARVFYAAGSGALQDVIIGISKVSPYRVFKVFMKHGDALWQSGTEKMNEIAFKYWTLKETVTV
jgi:hypothetical protein